MKVLLDIAALTALTFAREILEEKSLEEAKNELDNAIKEIEEMNTLAEKNF